MSAGGGNGGGPDYATGGSGEDGGNATAHATAFGAQAPGPSAYQGVTAYATARGGDGGTASGNGFSAGNGGSANATASAIAPNGASAGASVYAVGGSGGYGLNGASSGQGGDVVLVDTVSGSSSKHLTLWQEAVAGGSYFGGLGGNAQSALTNAANPGGGELVVTLVARSGSTFAPAQSATVSGTATGNAGMDVTLNARAEGRNASIQQLHASGSGAATVSVNGRVDGADGYEGSAGDDASLIDIASGSSDATLVLAQQAYAGDGGSAAGGLAGDGGNGGNGTTALTRTASLPVLDVRLNAAGGYGGRGGFNSGNGGQGGDGAISAAIHNDAGELALNGSAGGGSGYSGASGGHAGDAAASFDASNAGDGHAIGQRFYYGYLQANSVLAGGGQGGEGELHDGGDGGDANARYIATAYGNSDVALAAEAVGGNGGAGGTHYYSGGTGNGGRGGDATSLGRGENAAGGAADVSVFVRAAGGSGGWSHGAGMRGGDGGNADASARGTNAGSGALTVTVHETGGTGGTSLDRTADGGDGGSTSLVQAVAGSGNGRVTFEQKASGGRGGDGATGGDGGDASSVLDAVGSSEPLVVTLEAAAGSGGSGTVANGIGGDAHVRGSATGAGEVRLFGRVVGGGGGTPGNTWLESLAAASTGGGNVTVEGTLRGAGGFAASGLAAQDAFVEDAIAGTTSGRLTLEQIAIGGGGDSGFSNPPLAGDGGSAESRLTRTVAAADSQLATDARGGHGAYGGGVGGDATAFTDGIATHGRLVATANAEAGGSSPYFSPPGIANGGDAFATARARGLTPGMLQFAEASARGGDASYAQSTGSFGGDATADAFAFHEGEAYVESRATAVGGRGGTSGNASSHAYGRNNGTEYSAVRVWSWATGGDSLEALGGQATASAEGYSDAAEVTVFAHQKQGNDSLTSVMVDAVRGATRGELALHQISEGAAGNVSYYGPYTSRAGGSATSSLTAENPAGGDLALTSEARGGAGNGLGGGSAEASAHGRDQIGRSVRVDAVAVGGDGASSGGGGEARLGAVLGESTAGGDVTVVGTIIGGSGNARGANGAGAVLVDSVDGATSGNLELEQNATSGSGGYADPYYGDSSHAGLQGAAYSSLTRAGSHASLTVRTSAIAGGSAQCCSYRSARGDATAAESRASATNDAGAASASVHARGGSQAFADAASGGLGAGGDALGYATAHTTGDGHAVSVGAAFPSYNTQAGVFGGNGGVLRGVSNPLGAHGGDARSESLGVAEGDSAVTVYDNAEGGVGGTYGGATGQDISGEGGRANSLAHGENQGAAAVAVETRAVGGRGGQAYYGSGLPGAQGAAGGVATASASGSSQSGDVSVSVSQIGGAGGSAQAAGGAGASSVLVNAASGATAGKLTLSQHAVGGAGGYGSDYLNGVAGTAGSARSELDATNAVGGGALELFAEAVGGAAGSSGYQASVHGAGGDAEASAIGHDVAGAALVVHARAVGGLGELSCCGYSPGGRGGEAQLGRVYGESSAGGDVTVIGEIFAGASGPAAAGVDVALVNAVDGDTTGSLSLIQVAGSGGAPGSYPSYGIAGNASSELSARRAAAALSVASEAQGATAYARSDAENDSGDVAARSLAQATGDGGNATARTLATGHDPNAVVNAGAAPIVYPYPYYGSALQHGAYGGASQNGTGGVADSETIGVHVGGGDVAVLDYAYGGFGGYSSGNGGAARSSAIGRSHGAGDVSASSLAYGGGSSYGSLTPGGDAFAATFAETQGDVTANAVATGGSSGASARARSEAHGTSGISAAEARSSHFVTNGFSSFNTNLQASASGNVAGATIAEAVASEGALARATGANVFASIAGSPLSQQVGDLLIGDPTLASRLGSANVDLLGELAIGGIRSGDLSPDAISFGQVVADLGENAIGIGLIDPVLTGAGVTRVELVVSLDGVQILAQSFDGQTALQFFDDNLLVFATPHPPCPYPPYCGPDVSTIEIKLAVYSADDSSGFLANFLVAGLTVPEPETVVLLACAMAALVARRRSGRR